MEIISISTSQSFLGAILSKLVKLVCTVVACALNEVNINLSIALRRHTVEVSMCGSSLCSVYLPLLIKTLRTFYAVKTITIVKLKNQPSTFERLPFQRRDKSELK